MLCVLSCALLSTDPLQALSKELAYYQLTTHCISIYCISRAMVLCSNITGWEDLKHCPDEFVCRNCMPMNDTDPGTCWAVKNPLLYKLKSWGKVRPGGVHGKLSC